MNKKITFDPKRWFLAVGLLAAGILGAGYFFKVLDAHKHHEESLISFSLAHLKSQKNLVDVLVLGSGAAGSSAAMYATRNGYQTVVLHGPEPGGQLTKTTWVENIPGIKKILGQHAIAELQSQAKSFGAEYLQDVAIAIDTAQWPYTITTEDGLTIHAMAVIVATGASPRKLGVEGEEEYWGRGVTTCAICDAPFYKGKKVVVVGGGDSAAEEALQLASQNVASVTILVRKDEMRASCIMRERLAAVPTISIMYNVEIQKILGNDEEVTGIELKNNKTNEVTTVATDGVFLAIGHEPNTEIFKGVIDLDKNGYIEMRGRSQMTSMPGIFAAGDVEDKTYRQAVIAEGRGAIAALDAGIFLREIGFNKQISHELERRGAYFEPIRERTMKLKNLQSVDEFDELMNVPGVVVLDFYTQNCPTCLQLMPVVEAVAERFEKQVTFLKVDADQVPELVKKLHVPKVPTLVIFKDGALVARYNQLFTKSELVDVLNPLLPVIHG